MPTLVGGATCAGGSAAALSSDGRTGGRGRPTVSARFADGAAGIAGRTNLSAAIAGRASAEPDARIDIRATLGAAWRESDDWGSARHCDYAATRCAGSAGNRRGSGQSDHGAGG